jgi:hypothetical protein
MTSWERLLSGWRKTASPPDSSLIGRKARVNVGVWVDLRETELTLANRQGERVAAALEGERRMQLT